jgi:hypothetical protein
MTLVERADGNGLVAAIEILRRSPRVSKLILEGNLESLEEEIEGSVSYYKMQSMNQSLAALVVNRIIKLDTALAASTNPGDLDLILRKLLYASENPGIAEGNEMAEPVADFSKIAELQEIKRLYDEMQERHSSELAERDGEIERLRSELSQQSPQQAGGESDQLRDENDRLNRQLQLVREEYEAKIERLNARIRDLSESGGARPVAAGGDTERKGFFRR